LRGTELFVGASDDLLGRLTHSARAESFVKGDVVEAAFRASHNLDVITAGRAHVCRVSADGRELILREVREGDVFGLALLGRSADENTVLRAASQELHVYRLPARVVERALADDGALCLRALHLVSRSLLSVSVQSEALAFKPMRVRLAHILADLACDQGGRLVVRLTQEELATWVGSRQEDVSRALRELAKAGLVRPAPVRPGTEILDRDGLLAYE
jgi:CRP/FNR family transcriptional regulator